MKSAKVKKLKFFARPKTNTAFFAFRKDVRLLKVLQTIMIQREVYIIFGILHFPKFDFRSKLFPNTGKIIFRKSWRFDLPESSLGCCAFLETTLTNTQRMEAKQSNLFISQIVGMLQTNFLDDIA